MEMEMLILSVLVLFVSLYLFRMLNKNASRNEAGHHHQLQPPPGSSGWPIIGEGLSFTMTAKRGVPEKFIEKRRIKYSSSDSKGSNSSCKVFTTSLLRESVAVLCTAAGNKFLFSNENKLVHSWWPYTIYTIFPGLKKPDTHKDSIRLRKVMSPFFSPNCLQKHVGIMDGFTKRHMDEFWSDEKQVKVLALAKMHTFTLACKIFLNVEDPEVIAKLEEPIQHISAGFISTLPINLPGTPFNRAIRASKKVTKDLEEMVERRRIDLDRYRQSTATAADLDENNQDMMSKLLMDTYSNGRQMKETDISDIADKLKGLLIAGSDNVVTTICSMVIFLFQLPTVYDAVLKEQMEIADSKAEGELLNWGDIQKMKHTWNVACEVLRLEPPNPGTFREAMTDFVYEGYRIPKGMKLYWSVFSTHKNPEYFPDPEKFDPSRFEGEGPAPYSYVPFGGGPRMCPGREYARFTILVFMHNLVTRFRWEKIFPDEKMVMSPFLGPTRGLHVRLYPLPSTPSL
ncbi:PREDICTED: beta-amyrin 28-oxidase-like [Fragaria vesca subsp. vesca]|uniref:beta-amyrin 28-oxidase-like n=1 Tax=Fragaria vesca subsp. vesca TaxID=101020 RepID=UPI0002C37268|nr:PREDICTED: beta-amyrin 28-oxidase-like [Fragaria vesca subsp. vesca]